MLTLGGLTNIKPFACELYVFWNRPENYRGWFITHSMEFVLRLIFRLYGKNVKILSKRIAATASRPELIRGVAGLQTFQALLMLC
ncbi:MAG: hypothetical protein ABIT36_00365 [Steroidobacteraceae bacterium]